MLGAGAHKRSSIVSSITESPLQRAAGSQLHIYCLDRKVGTWLINKCKYYKAVSQA